MSHFPREGPSPYLLNPVGSKADRTIGTTSFPISPPVDAQGEAGLSHARLGVSILPSSESSSPCRSSIESEHGNCHRDDHRYEFSDRHSNRRLSSRSNANGRHDDSPRFDPEWRNYNEPSSRRPRERQSSRSLL